VIGAEAVGSAVRGEEPVIRSVQLQATQKKGVEGGHPGESVTRPRVSTRTHTHTHARAPKTTRKKKQSEEMSNRFRYRRACNLCVPQCVPAALI